MPEGCIDIVTGGDGLPEGWDRYPGRMARRPFWRDERGIHHAWISAEAGGSPVHVVVSTYDPETAELVTHAVYDGYPPDYTSFYANIYDAAGAPDGSFAVLVSHPGDWEVEPLMRVVLGHVEVPGELTEWVPPWPEIEVFPIDLGWDGEAFAVHAVMQGEPKLRLIRLAPDGSVVTPDTEVGTFTSTGEIRSAFHTDPETGTSWVLSSYKPGVLLTGHLRDGSPIPGIGPTGSEVITANGLPLDSVASGWPAIASDGTRALAAWQWYGTIYKTYLQLVDSGSETGDGLAIHDDPCCSSRKALARSEDGWWLAVMRPDGVTEYRLSDTEVVATSPLVTWPGCEPGCGTEFDLRTFSTVRWQDELWFGFWDFTAKGFGYLIRPYRIVRIQEGCSYRTMHEIKHAP